MMIVVATGRVTEGAESICSLVRFFFKFFMRSEAINI